MKLAFTGARKGPGPQPNEGRPRPFRKLKIAGGVLAAVSYAIWTGVSLQSNCICCNEQKEMKEKAKLEVQLHAEDSLRRARNWSPRDTQDAYMTGSISNCIYQRAKRLKEATNAGRHSLISDAVDEYEWTRHSGGTCNGISGP
jgi:hypothetical protein